MIASEPANVDGESDLESLHCPPSLMPNYHRHQGIELNFLERGSMTYLFAGMRRTVPAGRLAVFWATFPHRVLELSDDPVFFYVHIPLVRFLQWQLPKNLSTAVLNGGIAVDELDANAEIDRVLLPRWHDAIVSRLPEARKILFLELEARLMRVVCGDAEQSAQPLIRATMENDKVARMTSYIAQNYVEDMSVDDIAAVAGVHPKYALALFRRSLGITILEYLTQHRVSHAQRLLATTDASVVEIAFSSGFGSLSRFYNAFKQISRASPGQFRKSLHAPAGAPKSEAWRHR